MADQGRRLPEETKRYLSRLREVLSVREAAKQANVNKSTVQKYTGKKSA
jgi:DNA-binding transcriptional regulator YhcF (GntR family)